MSPAGRVQRSLPKNAADVFSGERPAHEHNFFILRPASGIIGEISDDTGGGEIPKIP